MAYCAFYLAYGSLYQRLGEEEFMSSIATTRPRAAKVSKGSVVGRLRIPRLQISAVIFEGTDESELTKGIGHWIGSPTGGDGNVVLAAHRDTFFRGLKEVRPGDEIELDTPSGHSTYSVSGTQIVTPDTMEVVQPTATPTLTLITCYPFEFFGHAPKRFIVHATE